MSLFGARGVDGEPGDGDDPRPGSRAWRPEHPGDVAGTGAGRLDTLHPLTNDLIAAVLESRDYKYFTDSDGDIGGHWDNNLIFFFRLGEQKEMFQIRIMARRSFEIDDVPRLYAFCNSWNHDKLWPKAYVHVDDDGTVGVYGEVTTDLEQGVSISQLDQLVACGISTGCALSDAVAELP